MFFYLFFGDSSFFGMVFLVLLFDLVSVLTWGLGSQRFEDIGFDGKGRFVCFRGISMVVKVRL